MGGSSQSKVSPKVGSTEYRARQGVAFHRGRLLRVQNDLRRIKEAETQRKIDENHKFFADRRAEEQRKIDKIFPNRQQIQTIKK